MRQIAAELRGTFRARAAQCHAVLVAHDRRAADRAAARQLVGHSIRRALVQLDLKNFGDDLPCLPDLDRVTDADVLFRDEILIVERRGCDRRPGQMHRRNDGARRQDACPPDLYHNILQHGRLDLRRIFERCGPARELRRAAHAFARGEVVQLHDRAVDVVGERIARLVEILDERPGPVHVAAKRVRDDLEAEASQIVQRLTVRPECASLGKL